jgi:myo-inositol-1(or 4)-monophosphatase
MPPGQLADRDPPATMPDRLREAARIAAAAADRALALQVSAAETITFKGPSDAMTAADLAVEDFIRTEMARAFPGEAVLGEERGGASSGTTWAVDPIDGTANYVKGSPFWGVSIGHLTNGQPDLGVVVLPRLGISVEAAGDAVFRGGAPMRRSGAGTEMGAVSLGHGPLDALDRTLGLHAAFRQAGFGVFHYRCTSLSLAFTALGMLDGHLQFRTKLWDIAAGAALCRAVGLEVRLGQDAEARPWILAGTAEVNRIAEPLWPSCIEQDVPA